MTECYDCLKVSLPGAESTKDVLIDAGLRYCAVFDPLDGSSNVDAGIPTGTILGTYYLLLLFSCSRIPCFSHSHAPDRNI